MADALEQLKERLAEVGDLGKVARLLSWDQQTMMPPAGTPHRAEQFATLLRTHARAVHRSGGRPLLDELRPVEESLDPDSDDGALIRSSAATTRRRCNVPASLRAEIGARAAAEARPVWVKAKAESDFASFLPVLERIVELKLEYVDCVADGADERYDVLLDDYEPQTTTAEVRALFDELKPPLVELIAELRERDVDDSFLVRRLLRPTASATLALRGDRPLRPPARQLADRPDRASVRVGRGPRRRPDHDELPPRLAPLALLDDARVRPRPLQPPAAAASRAAADRRAVLARDPRVAEPALGEPRRAQPAVLAALLSPAAGDVPRAARRRRPRAVPRRDPRARSPV